MKVLVTGISCSGWKEYVSEAIAETNIKFLDIGDTILTISQNQNLGFTDNHVLNAPSAALRVVRSLAGEKIRQEVSTTEHAIVGCHATFRWKTVLSAGFDPFLLNELKPDIYINIMDDLTDLKQGLDVNPKWHEQDLPLDEILSWREEEFFITHFLSEYARKEFYLLLRADNPANLRDIILKPDRKKAYLSFSITNNDPEELSKVEKFREDLRGILTVFDPLAMKENEIRDWDESRLTGLGVRIKERISSQTVLRDYQLIAQSDMLVVYMPENRFSAGVMSEIRTAHETGKKVYMVWPFNESPFLKFYLDKVFKSGQDAIDFLMKDHVV